MRAATAQGPVATVRRDAFDVYSHGLTPRTCRTPRFKHMPALDFLSWYTIYEPVSGCQLTFPAVVGRIGWQKFALIIGISRYMRKISRMVRLSHWAEIDCNIIYL